MTIQTRPQGKQPIPEDAKKVFQGKVYSVYQWEQEMFDGSKAIFEKVARADSATVIPVLETGEIILARQQQPNTEPFVGALGGRLDPGENALECAKRELLEEAGMEAVEYKEWYSVQPSGMIDWVDNGFIARGAKVVTNPTLDSGEKIELVRLTFEEFLQVAIRENYRDTQVKLRVVAALFNPEKKKELKNLFFG